MAKLSRDKGKRGELEVAALLKRYGFEARRGQQFKGGPGSPDVIHNIPGFHIEVKRTEAFGLYAALEQANAEKQPHEKAMVLHRRNDKPWVIVMEAEALLFMIAYWAGVLTEGVKEYD